MLVIVVMGDIHSEGMCVLNVRFSWYQDKAVFSAMSDYEYGNLVLLRAVGRCGRVDYSIGSNPVLDPEWDLFDPPKLPPLFPREISSQWTHMRWLWILYVRFRRRLPNIVSCICLELILIVIGASPPKIAKEIIWNSLCIVFWRIGWIVDWEPRPS